LKYVTWPYPEGLREELLRLSVEGKVHEVCQYNVLIGKIFADAARAVAKEARVDMSQVQLIGSRLVQGCG